MRARIKSGERTPLPVSFEELVRMMPPMAIADDIHHANNVEMIDRLMRVAKLSRGQAVYLETLMELVEVYEAKRHAVDVSRLSGLRMLKHVVQESGLSPSDLARLLKVHVSMGSKIMKGERQLTWEHAKTLAKEFKIAPALFMES